MSIPTGTRKIQILVYFAQGPELSQLFTMSEFAWGYEEEAYESLKDAAYEWVEKVMNDDPSYSDPQFRVTFEILSFDTIPYPPST